MNKMIYTRFERCSLCLGCEIACRREHDGRCLIRVISVDDRMAVPLTCRHCDPAPCALACPTQALIRTENSVRLDDEKCTGCTLCLYACPLGMMDLDPENKTALQCDLCAARLETGSDPACVRTCPTEALVFGEFNTFSDDSRRRASAEVLRTRSPLGGGA